MNVSQRTSEWLNGRGDRAVGSVVRTLDAGKPVKATRSEQGWEYEPDTWGVNGE